MSGLRLVSFGPLGAVVASGTPGVPEILGVGARGGGGSSSISSLAAWASRSRCSSGSGERALKVRGYFVFSDAPSNFSDAPSNAEVMQPELTGAHTGMLEGFPKQSVLLFLVSVEPHLPLLFRSGARA